MHGGLCICQINSFAMLPASVLHHQACMESWIWLKRTACPMSDVLRSHGLSNP